VKDLNEQKIYYDSKFLKESEVHLSPFNRGFNFGDGVFETIRVYSGMVFRLEEHIQRLFKGLEVLGIENGSDISSIGKAVKGLIRENGLSDACIKITAFREECPGLDPVPGSKVCFLIVSSLFDHKRKRKLEGGITAGIVSIRRNQTSPHVFIKSLNFLENILGRREAHKRGFDEAIFLNNLEIVTEGSISNIFIVKDSVLFTSPADVGILKGITRDVVLEIAGDEGVKCCEEPFKTEDIFAADEAFMTNSLMEIMPLSIVEGRKIGEEFPGKTTVDLMRIYREKVDKELSL